MKITAAQLRAIALGTPKAGNIPSVIVALDRFGGTCGLDRAHRLAHYIAQLAHESAGFRYDRELWGPTAAQRRYEGRKDLGNTQKGDGKKFAGRTAIQITGRYNFRQFSAWAKRLDPAAPDFEADPDLINTDPWEGLSPIWYWHVGNPTGKSLNVYADRNDAEMVTRRINGGLNGYADRLKYYTRAALVLLGYSVTDVKKFQRAAGLVVDGIAGPATRGALFDRLIDLDRQVGGTTDSAAPGGAEEELLVDLSVDDLAVDDDTADANRPPSPGGFWSGIAAVLATLIRKAKR